MTQGDGGARLLAAVRPVVTDVRVEPQRNGTAVIWATLVDRAALSEAAAALKRMGARLSVITAFARDRSGASSLAYHFDVAGSTVTLKTAVPAGEAVETIVPLFRNADWLEREAMELFDVEVSGRPDSRRLFLDESVDRGVMDRLLPLSVLSNAASTDMLFDRIAAAKEEEKKE